MAVCEEEEVEKVYRSHDGYGVHSNDEVVIPTAVSPNFIKSGVSHATSCVPTNIEAPRRRD